MTIQRILLRGGTAAEWASANPVLMEREPGIELDGTGGKLKFGDGVSAWLDLPYFDTGVGTMSLDALTDVAISSHAAGQILQSNGTVFVNVDASDVLIGILDTDDTLAADSDALIASQRATKTYVDTQVATAVEYEATFGFVIPNTTWTITHGRGTKALNVETFDDSDNRLIGEIEYPDNNTITISWYYPLSGSARVFS